MLQRDVAEIIGCTQTIYSRYESGDREPSLTTLVKLADFYNVSLDYLVGRSDNPVRR
nr:MAG TPA: helix-turn-helix XRE-family like protein [Caudoviricetes sp.]